MSEAPAETPPSQPKPKLPLLYPSRIIVFSLLAVALVALGFDLVARLKQNRAYGTLRSFVDEDQSDPATEELHNQPPTPKHVQELLGKAPDSQGEQGEGFQQVYTWQGVFNRYHLTAHYGGATLAIDDPKDAEPLLLRVEKSSNYIWEN